MFSSVSWWTLLPGSGCIVGRFSWFYVCTLVMMPWLLCSLAWCWSCTSWFTWVWSWSVVSTRVVCFFFWTYHTCSIGICNSLVSAFLWRASFPNGWRWNVWRWSVVTINSLLSAISLSSSLHYFWSKLQESGGMLGRQQWRQGEAECAESLSVPLLQRSGFFILEKKTKNRCQQKIDIILI